jgi:hypothetical protein
MRIHSSLLALVLGTLLISCQQDQTLFELKSPEETGITFANQIVESDSFNILTDEYIFNGGGVATADFDQNGLPDLFFTGNQVANRLYLNQGEFKFDDVSEQAGILAEDKWCTGSVVVDINNDGWPDIYVATAMKKGPGERNNLLFVNQGKDAQGNISFKEMASQYGIADPGNSMGAAFLDYDLDGDLDLYVLNNEQLAAKPTNFRAKVIDGSAINNDSFYRNNGDGWKIAMTLLTLERGAVEAASRYVEIRADMDLLNSSLAGQPEYKLALERLDVRIEMIRWQTSKVIDLDEESEEFNRATSILNNTVKFLSQIIKVYRLNS